MSQKEIGNEKVVKFENVGDSIEGEYVRRIQSDKYEGNYDYVFATKDGERHMVFGTAVINSKMRVAELGKVYKLEYKGEVTDEEGEKRTYKDFKLFSVD